MAKSIEINGLEEVLKVPEQIKSVVRKSASRAINRTSTYVKSQVSIRARGETTVKAAYAKKGITIPYKATVNKLGSKVVISGKRIPLIGYAARAVRKGVSGRIFKAEPIILRPRAFIATMRSGHKGVFWRDTRRSGGIGSQGGVWNGDLRSFYILLAAMKRKYPNQQKDLTVRLGITELYGPALPDLIKDDLVWLKLKKDADVKVLNELESNMNYYLDQIK